ncbi:MAG: iron export ABC transporter permease subunit FetB [Oligoflexales bacterium]|nr:iron export ABC transporter permease subunit FetB [Oligoflexales bacterium]
MTSNPSLSIAQLSAASMFIFVNALLSFLLKLEIGKTLLISAFRSVVQLGLVGVFLSWVFTLNSPYPTLMTMASMSFIAAYTAASSSKYHYNGLFWHSVVAVGISSWLLVLFPAQLILNPTPWYQAQYLIPFLGMLLGNSLNGISLALNTTTQDFLKEREKIEQALSLGADKWEAARSAVKEAIKMGTIPSTNAMMIAGLVSLPGMMTGQILAGMDPYEAAKYQVFILFLITGASFFGTMLVVYFCYRSCFNQMHQFSTKHLKKSQGKL